MTNKRFTPAPWVLALLGSLLSLLLSLRYIGRDLWYDEAFSLLAIEKPWHAMMTFLGSDVHPPLYYILLKLWGGAFGTSPEALRALSLLAFFGTAALLWQILRRAAPTLRVPLLWFFLLSPFFIGYATEMRMYTLWTFFLVSACWGLLRYQEEARFDHLLIYGACMGLAFLTHYFSIFFIALSGLGYLALLLREPKRYPWWHLPILAIFFTAPIFWWLPSAIEQYTALSASGLSSWWVLGLGWEVLPKISGVLLFGHPFGNIANLMPFEAWQSWAGIGIFVVLFASLRRPKNTQERYALFLVYLGLGAFAIFLWASWQKKNFFTERYFYPYALFLLLGLQIFFARLRIVSCVLFTVLFALWSVHYALYQPSYVQQQKAQEIQQQPAGRAIVVTDALNYLLLYAYTHRPLCFYNASKPEEGFWGDQLVSSACVYKDIKAIPADALWLY